MRGPRQTGRAGLSSDRSGLNNAQQLDTTDRALDTFISIPYNIHRYTTVCRTELLFHYRADLRPKISIWRQSQPRRAALAGYSDEPQITFGQLADTCPGRLGAKDDITRDPLDPTAYPDGQVSMFFIMARGIALHGASTAR